MGDSHLSNLSSTLNRHQRDAIARFVMTRKGTLLKSEKKIATDLAPLFRPMLEANGILPYSHSKNFVRGRKLRLEKRYSRELIHEITERIRKLIPSLCPFKGLS